MDKFRGNFQTLYHREDQHSPDIPLATHLDPAQINDKIALEAGMEAAVCRLRPHRAGGYISLRMDHFKQWWREAYPGEHSNNPLQMAIWM